MIVPERYREDYLPGLEKFAETGTGNAIGKTHEFQAIRRDGTEIPVELSLSAVLLKGESSAVGIIKDISKRKRTEAEMEHMAYHDALTGLPNRLLLDDRLKQSIAHAGRSGHMVAVLFFDLDNFKSINDGLGHPAGDRFLRIIALARILNLQVTAEGVETMDQADFFSREECDAIQGRLIGMPLGGDELMRLLSGRDD